MAEHDLDPRRLTGAFALCPHQWSMAVGGSSHIHLVSPYYEIGCTNFDMSLMVECSVRAPGARRLTWSSHGHQELLDHPESPPPCLEHDVYPLGLIAGGFDDGVVSIWEPPIVGDDAHCHHSEKLKLVDDEEATRIAVREMFSSLEPVTKKSFTSKVKAMPKKVSPDKKGVSLEIWDLLEDDTWAHSNRANKAIGAELGVLLKMKILEGPVHGLCFNPLHPNWLAAAAYGEKITICNLSSCMDSSHTFELSDVASKRVEAQMTSLDWNVIYPVILASTNDQGISKIWDVRIGKSHTTLEQGDKKTCTDIKWSPYNPLHFAVATKDGGSSAAVKVWDLRQVKGTLNEYGSKGVTSLSWGRGGSLLNSHVDGTISCAFPYDDKLKQFPSSHGNLGVTWFHSHDMYVTLSNKSGLDINTTDQNPLPSCGNTEDDDN